jgi:uncharacterized damage-inducible protein DinB
MSTQPEAWLRGPVEGIAPVLQPAAHALIQAREDVEALAATVGADVLWTRVDGAASAGFHLLHLAGALDRLFTYARGEGLNEAQKVALRAEGQDHPHIGGAALAAVVATQIERALAQLASTDPAHLFDERKIGRAGLPSNVLGLLFHAAEHTTRHVGQFVTTIKLTQARLVTP